MSNKKPHKMTKEKEDLITKISKIELENEGWSLIKTHREYRLESDLIRTEIERNITLRTYHEYNVLVEVAQYKKGKKTKRLEEVKEKIFLREYKRI